MIAIGRAVLALGLLAVLAGFARAQPPGSAAPECPPAAGALAPSARLPHLAAALRPGGHLAILAVGSASTEAGLYLAGLRRGLAAARPDLIPSVTVAAARGEDAAEGLHRLQAALGRGHFDLVLWQTGTVDAVRGASPDDLADTLDQGAEDVARHGASLVLIDPQFSRLMRANVDLEPYETALRAVALRPDAVLFPRWEITQVWAEQDGLDPEHAPSRKAARAAAGRAQTCLGAALARFLLAAGAAGPAR